MDISAAAEALMRRKLLESIYDRMTDEEKKLFIQMTMQQRSADEIMSALHRQSSMLDTLYSRQRSEATEFANDVAGNVLGNALWSGLTWLARRLFG